MIGNRLVYGDTIGVICPASGERNPIMDNNLNQLRNLGFNIKEGAYLRKCGEYLAGTDTERAEDFMNMFTDPTVKAILCYRGGYGSIRMMQYIDWRIIKRNPKIFCGYSDITLLINYINKTTGLITFHSPMVNSKFSDTITKNYFLNLLMNSKDNFSIDLNQFSSINSYNKKSVKGYLCGGNLSMICSSLKTPYEVDTNNKILFIEDINEENYVLDRMLTQLLLADKLSNCRAFILGHYTPRNTTTNNVLKNILLPLNKPIIMNFPCGHDYPNITLPIGAKVSLDFENNNLTILEPVIK